MSELRLTAEELVILFKAHQIGAISHDGDGWYAKDAGYDYDEAEATMQAAGEILARLARAVPGVLAEEPR